MVTRIIPIPTATDLYNDLLADVQAFVQLRRGTALDLSEADGVSLIIEATARTLITRLETGEIAVQDALPSVDSSHIDEWVGLLGITRNMNETNVQLWARRNQLLLEASLGSLSALRELVLLQGGIQDVAFAETNTGDFNVYLVSSEPPPTGQPQGHPLAEQNAAISTLLNDGRRAHLGKTFTLVNPTITRYAIFATVYYRASDQPDFDRFKEEVAEGFRSFVRFERRFNRPVHLFNLYLHHENVVGLERIEAGLFETAPTSGDGAQGLADSTSAVEHVFSCTDTVNEVTAQTDALGQIVNLLYVTVT